MRHTQTGSMPLLFGVTEELLCDFGAYDVRGLLSVSGVRFRKDIQVVVISSFTRPMFSELRIQTVLALAQHKTIKKAPHPKPWKDIIGMSF